MTVRPLVVVLLLLAAAVAAVGPSTTFAQQPQQPPSELWSEFPLNPGAGTVQSPEGSAGEQPAPSAPQGTVRGGADADDESGSVGVSRNVWIILAVAVAASLAASLLLAGAMLARFHVLAALGAVAGAVVAVIAAPWRAGSWAGDRTHSAWESRRARGRARRDRRKERRRERTGRLRGIAAVLAPAGRRPHERTPRPVETPARRLANAAGTVSPPRLRMPQRLRSEAESLVPLAEPPAREKHTESAAPNKVSGGEAPPQKPLPGVAPPPAKERQVRSGLPLGKTVPRPSEPPPKEQPAPPTPEPAPPAAAIRPFYAARRVEPRGPGRRTAGVRGRVEECEIEWWRGYVMSDFYAFALRPGGPATILARSQRFRWRQTDPPPHEGPAAEAHTALVERLGAEGWEPVGTGAAWYRTRLRRRLKPTLRDFADSAGRSAG
jgi:hypothetical protein